MFKLAGNEPLLFSVSGDEIRQWIQERIDGEKHIAEYAERELAASAQTPRASAMVTEMIEKARSAITAFGYLKAHVNPMPDQRLTLEDALNLREKFSPVDIPETLRRFRESIDRANAPAAASFDEAQENAAYRQKERDSDDGLRSSLGQPR